MITAHHGADGNLLLANLIGSKFILFHIVQQHLQKAWLVRVGLRHQRQVRP